MNIAQRISVTRTALDLSQEEFSRRLGYSRNYISRLETGRSANPSKKFLAALDDMNAEVRAHKLAEQPAHYSSSKSQANVDPKVIQLRKIPVFSFVQAGQATDFETLPRDWEDEIAYLGNDPGAFGLRITGDSMESKYSPGDIVIISPRYPAKNGDLVVANIKNEGVLFKIMHHSGDHGMIELTSYNSAYPALRLTKEKFHWIYPVKTVMKRLP